MAKTLIAFFSRADENYFSGAMRYVKVGNTEIVCNLMQEMIPADTFKIEMKNNAEGLNLPALAGQIKENL